MRGLRLWNEVLGSRVKALTPIQVDGLKRDEFLHEDGGPVEEAEMALLSEARTSMVTLEERKVPTIRRAKRKTCLIGGESTGNSIETNGLQSWLLILDDKFYFFGDEIPKAWY